MAVALTPEVEQRLQRHMKEGRWRSPSDVVLTALDLLDNFDGVLVTNRDELEARLQEGLDDIERGDVYTEEEVRAHLAEVRARLSR